MDDKTTKAEQSETHNERVARAREAETPVAMSVRGRLAAAPTGQTRPVAGPNAPR